MSILSDEDRYYLLKLLEEQPELNQREIARKLDISLGKVNFCLKALVSKGLIKTKRFCTSSNKRAYLYILTLKGIEEKGKVTFRFLARKQNEHEQLVKEINELKIEALAIEQKPEKSSRKAG